MLRWRGTPLDQLSDPQLEEAIEKALEIVSAMYTERQRRKRRYHDEIHREAEQAMQLESLRKNGRIRKRF